MISGFVEKQQIWLCQKQLGKSHAHLPSAGELVDRARRIVAREAQPVEHLAYLCLERVPVVSLKFRFNAVVAVRDFFVLLAIGIKLSHLMRERFHLPFNIEQMLEYRKAFFRYASARKRQSVLRQVPGGYVLACRARSSVQSFHSRENLQ